MSLEYYEKLIKRSTKMLSRWQGADARISRYSFIGLGFGHPYTAPRAAKLT